MAGKGLALGVAGAAAVALAGCGSSGARGGVAALPAPTVTVTAAPVAGTSSSGSGATVGRCHTSQLALRPGVANAAMGTWIVPFGLRNTSSRTCTIRGFVGAQLYDAGGTAITTTLTREKEAPTTVTLKPNAAAYFYLAYQDATRFVPPCTPDEVAEVAVTPPDETTQLSTGVTMQPCGGMIRTAPVAATG